MMSRISNQNTRPIGTSIDEWSNNSSAQIIQAPLLFSGDVHDYRFTDDVARQSIFEGSQVTLVCCYYAFVISGRVQETVVVSGKFNSSVHDYDQQIRISHGPFRTLDTYTFNFVRGLTNTG